MPPVQVVEPLESLASRLVADLQAAHAVAQYHDIAIVRRFIPA